MNPLLIIAIALFGIPALGTLAEITPVINRLKFNTAKLLMYFYNITSQTPKSGREKKQIIYDIAVKWRWKPFDCGKCLSFWTALIFFSFLFKYMSPLTPYLNYFCAAFMGCLCSVFAIAYIKLIQR